jgi:hypothetical protein
LAHYLSKSFLPECGWLLGAVLLTWWFRKTSPLSKCQAALSLLWVLGLGRETGAENYYLEFILYGIYFLGEGWLSREQTGYGKGSGRIKNPEILLMALLTAGLASFGFREWPHAPPAGEMSMKGEMLEIYRLPGEHLALDLDLPLMAGKRLWIQPAEYCALVNKGFWSEEPLLGDICSKKFSTIELYDIPQQYLLPPRVVEEIKKNYYVAERKYGRLWLEPGRAGGE